MQEVSFIHMKDGTAEDYAFLDQHEKTYVADLPARLMEALKALENSLGGYKVSRLEHSLQSATHALNAGESEEMIVAALLHDIGDELAPCSHSEMAAAILRPYVSDHVYQVVRHHGLFQTYYYNHHFGRDRNIRDRYRDEPWYEDCVKFCENYDQNCFDPDFDSKPLEFFRPMVERVCGSPRERFT